MRARHLLIVNPHSANRSTGRLWPKMEQRLRPMLAPCDAILTKAPGDATRLAREAAGRYESIVAVGGDGTVGEVVNGLIDEDGAARPGVALGVIPRGTGNDFVRSLRLPTSLKAAAAVLARGRRREVDVGRARFLGPDGASASRYFINAAEVGMGAVVSEAVSGAPRWFGGSAAFLWVILGAMLRDRGQRMSLSVNGAAPETMLLSNAWIANGCYSGGGIRSAPRARLDDAALDLVRVAHTSLPRRAYTLLKLRSGAFVDLPHVEYRQVRCVEFTSETPVPVETDGDPVGTVPATFDVLPARLTVIA